MTIKEGIERRLRELSGAEGGFSVSVPDGKATDADYSSNAAFILAKAEQKSPRETAENLVRAWKESPFPAVERIEISPNGFVNFWISGGALREEISSILKNGPRYGSSQSIKGRLQVEYISANPTGPLTLANGRGGFYGNALANVLAFSGAKVEREYYVNDSGNQVLTLGKSIVAALGLIDATDEFYKGEYVKTWAEKNRAFVEKHAADPEAVGERAADDFMEGIRSVVEKKSGIVFDRYTSERSIRKKKLPAKALDLLRKSGRVYEKDGAVWLRTTDSGDDKDRVLVTKDGLPTYLLVDAGHYLETKKRGFDWKINILGPDHYGYVRRIQAVADILGLKRSDVLITQAILIKKGEEFVKMSKRKGSFVTFEDLVDEVGVDVAKFFFLAVGTNSHIDFDLDLAKERSSKNPVFYAEYAYVRAKKILAKAGGKPKGDPKLLSALSSPSERELMMALASFPDAAKETAGDYEIHRLTRYLVGTVKSFHNFYEAERVIGGEHERAKLALVAATVIVLGNVFRLLGIVPPEEM